ncbi:MAG: formate--tetrahydrofolate ligase [Treponema sp.]|nr:formate--tetrahydrofolate ligase [Clostridia bacterium]MBP3607279.1 formate--tetrahydrofolate ligase [Treponema sp.]
MMNIKKLVKSLKLKDFRLYGEDFAKVEPKNNESKYGKLVLVSAINPTPYGEGKTTVAIGLADALNKKYKTMLALREPSMGPVFGRKGGATGSGKTQLIPSEEINLHFTGDIHALTYAVNYIAAYIDNHIYRNNTLNISKVVFTRCLDVNDRSLRDITTSNKVDSHSSYVITAAHEIMVCLCLATDENDFYNRIENILIGYDVNNNKLFIRDLGIELIANLKHILAQVVKPNLVQTLAGTPSFIHGGPFANIAHGCSSIIATNTALSVSDYVITEAGFGVDLGAEKFLDIKCRVGNFKPSAVVIVVTKRAIEHHGYANGLQLTVNYCKMLQKVYGVPVVVAINKFANDTLKDLYKIKDVFTLYNISSEICSSWEDGPIGAKKLAKAVIEQSNKDYTLNFAYDMDMTTLEKVESIIHKVYGIHEIEFQDEYLKSQIKTININDFYVCIAKTPFSISSDPNKLGHVKDDFEIKITDIDVLYGAKIIRIHCGKMYFMPGLP